MRRTRTTAERHQQGFTLIEIIVTLAITGVFLLMVTGLVQTSTQLATKQQSITERRSDTRFSLDLMASEIAGAGTRVPLIPAFDAPGTLNEVADPAIADVGSDTFTLLRSRSGSRSFVLAQTGSMATGTMRLQYHHEDNQICDTAANCAASFIAEYGDVDQYLAIGADGFLWVVRITATPTATLGAGGGINVSFDGVFDNAGGLEFSPGDSITGLTVTSFRVMNEALEMKTDFLAGPGTFLTIANRIEDMQLAYLMADGTYVNDGLPADVQAIRAVALSVVSVAPIDRAVGGNPFNRPEVEDHAEGTVFDRRRRTLARQIVWTRNV